MLTAWAALAFWAVAARAIDNGLGLKPPMGWRSWNAFGKEINSSRIKAIMDALVKPMERGQSFKDLGFSDVGLDDNWQACGKGVYHGFHDALGRPLVNEDRFPDLRGLTSYAHSLGLTAGWYVNNCICSENGYHSLVEISSHYHGDVARLVDLHFDGVKLDHCGQFNNLDRWARILNASGRPVLIENCHWVGLLPRYEAEEKGGDLWCPFNYFRTSGDIDHTFDSMLTNLQTMTKWADLAKPISQPGCWAYPDMLEVGSMPTELEDRAHFGAWCVVSAPLVLSLDLTQEETARRIWPVVSNPELLEVNQQWAGHPGTLVYSSSVHLEDLAKAYIWGVACNASNANQQGWRRRPVAGSDEIMVEFGDSGLCADATVPNPVGLAYCREGNARQRFRQEARGSLKMRLNAEDEVESCLEVFGKTGPGLQVTDCWSSSAAAHQQFLFEGGKWADRGTKENEQYPPRCMERRDAYPYDLPAHYIGWQIWAKPMPGGTLAVYVVNREAENLQPVLDFTRLKEVFKEKFKHEKGEKVLARDLYKREYVGEFTGTMPLGPLEKHDSRFYLLSKAKKGQLPPRPPGRSFPSPMVWLLGLGIWGMALAGLGFYAMPLLKSNASSCEMRATQEDSSSGWSETESESGSSDDEPKLQSLEVEQGTSRGPSSTEDVQRQEWTRWSLHVLLVTLMWWAAAIYVKLMFKLTVRTALPPFILTCLVSTTTGAISWILSLLQHCGVSAPRPEMEELAKVVLLGIMTGCEFGFLNKSLEGLSVTESTMLQNINVLFMMITAWMCDLESLTIVRLVAGLLLAAGGTLQGLASSGHKASVEEGDAHVWGLLCMLISMIITSAKWSLIQFMTQLSPPGSFLGQLSKLQLAALVQPITGVVCLVLACIFERAALFNVEELVTAGLLLRVPAIALGITVISCSELKVVELTSAVACGILINLHHIPMVLAGIITLHDSVDQQGVAGFGLCLLGGVIYAYSRYIDKTAKA